MLKKLLHALTALTLSTFVAGAGAASSGDQFSGIKQQLADEQRALKSEELKKLIEIERKKLTEGLKRLEELEARVEQMDGGKPATKQAAKPKAQTSARLSTAWPRACSGLM